MDALVLALLWVVVVVPVGVKAFQNRRDSIAEFERALDSLQPSGQPRRDAPAPPERPLSGIALTLRRRRRVVVALGVFASCTAIGAAVIQSRAALAAGALALHMCVAYAAAIVSVDRRSSRVVIDLRDPRPTRTPAPSSVAERQRERAPHAVGSPVLLSR